MFIFSAFRFCIDNGAMIAYAGSLQYYSSRSSPNAFSIDDATVRQRYCLFDTI